MIEEDDEPDAIIDDASKQSARSNKALTVGSRVERQRPWARPAVLVVGCVLLAVLVFGGYQLWKSRSRPFPEQLLARSIAVLPFKPLVLENRDPALELGMTDALITKLSNIREMVVRPTSAVLKYSDAAQDPLAAGREQGVDVVLDGKVQRAGDRVRVTVQLVRVSDGVALWGREFDESFTNIFSVQNSVFRAGGAGADIAPVERRAKAADESLYRKHRSLSTLFARSSLYGEEDDRRLTQVTQLLSAGD